MKQAVPGPPSSFTLLFNDFLKDHEVQPSRHLNEELLQHPVTYSPWFERPSARSLRAA